MRTKNKIELQKYKEWFIDLTYLDLFSDRNVLLQ